MPTKPKGRGPVCPHCFQPVRYIQMPTGKWVRTEKELVNAAALSGLEIFLTQDGLQRSRDSITKEYLNSVEQTLEELKVYRLHRYFCPANIEQFDSPPEAA